MCLCVYLDIDIDTSVDCTYLCVCCVYLFVYAGTYICMFYFHLRTKKKHLILMLPFLALTVIFSLAQIRLQILQQMESCFYNILKVNISFICIEESCHYKTLISPPLSPLYISEIISKSGAQLMIQFYEGYIQRKNIYIKMPFQFFRVKHNLWLKAVPTQLTHECSLQNSVLITVNIHSETVQVKLSEVKYSQLLQSTTGFV